MQEFIASVDLWDKELLLFLNGFHNSFFDGLMYMFSDKFVWIPMYCAMLWPIIKNKRYGAVTVIVCIALCVLFADQFASGICKPFFERFRPAHDPEIGQWVHTVAGGRGGKYGFISSHASNTFAVAVFTALLFRNRLQAVIIFVWAVVNCYSRIYLGYHFPMDLFFGALAGVAVGFICWGIYISANKYLPEKTGSKEPYSFKNSDFALLTVVFIVTIFHISLFASKGFIV